MCLTLLFRNYIHQTVLEYYLEFGGAQLGVSSGAYYMMSKSDHKIQLPMAMLNTMPDEIKEQLDITAVITTLLSTTDNQGGKKIL